MSGLDPQATIELPRSIARNTAFNFLGRFLQVAGWLVIAPLILSRLGTERFGLWALVTLLTGLYQTFDLGMSQALTQLVAGSRASGDARTLRGVWTAGLLASLALSASVAAVLIGGRRLVADALGMPMAHRAEGETALIAAAATFASSSLLGVMASVLAGLHRMDLWNRIWMGVTLLQFAGVVATLAMGGGVGALVIVAGASAVGGVVIAWLAIRRLAPEIGFDPRAARSVGLRITSFGGALQLIGLGILVQFQLEKILFSRILALDSVAEYELGSRAALAAWSVPLLMLPALIPAVSHLDAAGERARIQQLYWRASRYLLAVALPLSAALVVLAPALMRVWLGPGHDRAALACSALGAFLGVNMLAGVGSSVLRGMGRPWPEARYHLLAIALHVWLSLVLIPRFGFVGGLWGLFLSGTAGILYFVWASNRFLGVSWAGYLGDLVARPAIAAGSGAALAAWLMHGFAADPGSWSRGSAIAELAAGAAALVITAAAVLFGSRYLRWSDVTEVVRLAISPRGRAEGGAGD